MTMKMQIESQDCDKLKGALAEAARVDASQVGIRTSGEMSSHWYQIVRVWYEV
jgi:hypothetical protein